MIIELGKLLNEVKTDTVTSEKGDRTVLNNRIMIYQGKNRSTFVDITVWGKTAEFVENHFKQHDEIYIEGELKNKVMTVGDKQIQGCFILVSGAKMVFGKNVKTQEQED